MDIQTKFNLGQPVWAVSTDYVSTIDHCKLCNDTKQVVIQGQDFICPGCVNNRHRKSVERAFVCEESVVGNVRISLYVQRTHEGEFCEDFSRRANKDERQYMLRSTGIGSGTLWPEDKLFGSKEEAQAWCDRWNAAKLSEESL